MDSAKQLRDLSKVYMEAVYGGGKKEEKKDTRLTVTAADKKANTKAYQNYKAGNKAYKAADHLGEGIKGEDNETRKAAAAERRSGVKTRLSPSEGKANVANMLYKIRNAKSNPKNESVSEDKDYGYDKDGNSLNPKDKKAKKDFDGDGKLESPEAEYKGSKDKAIKKEVEDLQKAANTGKGKYVAKADKVKGVGESVESDEYIEIVQQIKSAETQADIKRWKSLEESGKFTAEEIDTIMEADIADILARLEKKRISKGGDPDESPLGKKTGQAMKAQQDKQRKKAGLKTEDVEIEEGVYEKQKTKEVMGALKKRDLKKDVKKKIAADIVKKKGDTSKSDDRYAYESKLWDQVAANLTELGDLNDADFRVEGYQRNPEKGEEESRKAKRERKGGYDEKREKRMSSPTRGIDSPAFKEFMRSRGM